MLSVVVICGALFIGYGALARSTDATIIGVALELVAFGVAGFYQLRRRR